MTTGVDLAALLSQLAAGLPDLHRGACRGHADIMDARTATLRAQAEALCASCPVRQRCADWLHSLPQALRPHGVCAGEYQRHTPHAGDGAADWIEVVSHRQPDADSRRAAAAQWLRAQLADGPVLSDRIQAAGLEAGFQRHVLFWARRAIGAAATRDGGRHTVWQLQP